MKNKKKGELSRKHVLTLAATTVIFVAGFCCGVKFDRFVKRKALDIVYF